MASATDGSGSASGSSSIEPFPHQRLAILLPPDNDDTNMADSDYGDGIIIQTARRQKGLAGADVVAESDGEERNIILVDDLRRRLNDTLVQAKRLNRARSDLLSHQHDTHAAAVYVREREIALERQEASLASSLHGAS
jgi:hypothetical protein